MNLYQSAIDRKFPNLLKQISKFKSENLYEHFRTVSYDVIKTPQLYLSMSV